MKNKIIISLASCFLFSTLNLSIAQSYFTSASNSGDYSLLPGEELTYIVRYAFFNLGEVKFLVSKPVVVEGKTITKTTAYMDSYEGLPFIDLHQIYYSSIDENFFPVEFMGLMLEEDTNFVKYSFSGDSLIIIKKGNYNSGKIRFDSTASVNKKFQDGLSILYFARRHLGNEVTFDVPCFVNEKKETTTINFYKENMPVEIGAVDYEIDCLHIDGKTDFVSVYGLTGQFEGWFSNDKYAVPISARMNVIIGSITLELIKWNIKDWNPPEYIN